MMNTPSKILSLLLLSLTSPTPTNAESIEIEWVIPTKEAPYTLQKADVGDKAFFYWPTGVPHNVFIHPTGTCNQEGMIYVGADPLGTEYTFTEADAGNKVTFSCNVGAVPNTHCTYGQIMTFQVMGLPEDTMGTMPVDEEIEMGILESSPDILEMSPDILEDSDDEESGAVVAGRFGLLVWGGVASSLLYVAMW